MCSSDLAYLALELRPAVAAERGVLLRRSVVIGALALGSTAAGAAVLGAGALPAGGNLAWEAIGVAAAVGVVAVLTRLAREHAAD